MQFNFLHRFRASDAPTRKVSNVPTFITTYSLFSRTIVGFQYSSNSDLVSRIPNEWELFGRWAPLAGDSDSPIEAAVTVGYNDAAQSGDGELSLGLPLGQLRLLGVARAFSDGYGAGESRFAVGGGATLQLNRYLALAGDITSLLDRADTEEIAWGAALQIAIPYTPHTLSLQVTNTNTATMQGASRGISDAQWGFEFTVPLTMARLVPPPTPGGEAEEAPLPVADDNTVIIDLQGMRYGEQRTRVPLGTRVVWVNRDAVVHTSTSRTGAWNSGLIPPGGSWDWTFDEPGEFPYFCVPHPFMTGVVEVEEN